MSKYVLGLALGIIIIGGVIYYVMSKGTPTPAAPSPQAQTQPATSTYSGSNFTLIYPSDFNVDPTYHYDAVSASKPIFGVKFTIPTAMATGTNLASDTYLS